MQEKETIILAVYDVLAMVGKDRGIEIENIEDSQTLVDELGFQSIDLARIITNLEFTTGLDPFSLLIPITSVRTVEDLYSAYIKCAEQQPPQA